MIDSPNYQLPNIFRCNFFELLEIFFVGQTHLTSISELLFKDWVFLY